jgi:Tol biopolymer transport system component
MTMKALALAALLAAAVPALAQTETPWDVTLARGTTREIDFTTREGTWMSLDLSPDGKWIVFDLLGHIYRLAVEGGEAECLTQASGVALNIQPRFSPDGGRIAFVSDRAGHPHLWIMNADGSGPRRVPTDPRYRLLQPAWGSDGKHLFARRGDGLFRIPLDGKTEEQLVEGRVEWPSPSRDGRFLYFYALEGEGGPLLDGRKLRRLDLSAGAGGKAEDVPVAALPGGAMAPEISPDGRWLAFARRVPGGTTTWRGHTYAARTVLRLRDLETGDERVVLDPIETDLSINSDSRRLREVPGYAWSADGSSILLTQGGQIRRLRVRDGRVETIPFTARVRRTISQRTDAPRPISDGPVRVRMLRWPVASPDGNRLAFQALNKIWVTGGGRDKNREDSSPRRLTPESFPDPEHTPSWSPDGRWVAFATWDLPGRGHVWKAPADGGEPVRLTHVAGEYLHPVWSSDGRELLIVRGPGVYAPGFTWADNPWYEIALLPSEGGEPRIPQTLTRVSRPRFVFAPYDTRREIARPSFGPEGRIFFPEHREQDGWFVTDLVSMDRRGGDRKVHATFQNAEVAAPSPDGRWIVWEEGFRPSLSAARGGRQAAAPGPARRGLRRPAAHPARRHLSAVDRPRHRGLRQRRPIFHLPGTRGLPAERAGGTAGASARPSLGKPGPDRCAARHPGRPQGDRAWNRGRAARPHRLHRRLRAPRRGPGDRRRGHHDPPGLHRHARPPQQRTGRARPLAQLRGRRPPRLWRDDGPRP